MELLTTPTFNPANNKSLFQYLLDIFMNDPFAISVLKVLIEEMRSTHRKSCKKINQQQVFKVGDIIKAHIQVQSKEETREVKKLSSKSQGLLQVKQF